MGSPDYLLAVPVLDPLLAYGPAPGVELIPYFLGLLAWAGLANTYYWIDPAHNVGGVILMQLFPFADKKALDLFSGFERAVYERLDESKRASDG